MENRISKKIFYTIVCVLLGLWACDKTEPSFPEQGRTLLVYIASDDYSLDRPTIANIRGMAEGMKGQNGRVVVYIDGRYDVPHLLEIRGGTNPRIDTVKTYAEENSASPETLHRVLVEILSDYPAESYGLVLSSHGMAWLPDNYSFPSINRMQMDWDLGIPTKWFGQDEHRGEANDCKHMEIDHLNDALPRHFDFILFDACFMGSVEVLYELRDKADYFIVSPAEVLIDGFPYGKIMPYLYGEEDDLKQVCREYFEYYNSNTSFYGTNSATVALVKSKELDALAAIVGKIMDGGEDFASSVWRYPLSDSSLPDVFYDFGDYIRLLATGEQQARFQEQLEKTVISKLATSEFFGKPVPYDKFSGLSVYIPQSRWQSMNEVYSHLSWYRTVYRY